MHIAWTLLRLSAIWLLIVTTEVTAQDKSELPEPELIRLTTKDFVLLNCVYYAGKPSKSTVPVILLHGSEGPRGAGDSKDCERLAFRLQGAGHTVVVPDLRGYGKSTIRRPPRGDPLDINRSRMPRREVADMQWDVEAVKRFLLEKNNKGELNIELLCVVGFEMGAVVGANWVSYDWSVPSLPTYKQGQDVKAFVLVSPIMSYRGVSLKPALDNPVVRGDLSAMIILGSQHRTASDGKRIFNSLKRAHRPIPRDADRSDELQDLFLVELNTSLKGTKLVSSPALQVPDTIASFIDKRLVNNADEYPWRDRTRP